MKVLDLFSGIGGISLGLERAGMQTVAFCEIEPFPRRVLAHHWPEVPIHGDIATARFEQPVDLVSAGFPCQDISLAGKGAGLTGERSGLFWHILRAVRMVGQPKLLLENVAALLDRGMGAVLGAMATIGYDAEWNSFPAAAVGAPQSRDRLWITAHPRQEGCQRPVIDWNALQVGNLTQVAQFGNYRAVCGDEWAERFPFVSLGDGLPSELVRGGVTAAGNSVVPKVPEMIGKQLMEQAA